MKKIRTNKFSKFARCKINIQTSISILYIDNDPSKNKIKQTIPFLITSNN